MKKYHVLMIEDDMDDRYIAETYFSANNIDVSLEFFSGSGNVLRHLSALAASDQFPHLILLNPGKHNMGILQQLKTHPEFRGIPVVVLTDSTHPEMVAEAYRLGANSVIQKPSTHALTQDRISTFGKYWFETVILPD
jgi:CheY-like chemotaxis protein